MPTDAEINLANLLQANHLEVDEDGEYHPGVAAVISIVTSMARSYTRGGGFTNGEPNAEIQAVILTASARLLAHPRQVPVGETMGPMSVNHGAGFSAWTVAELFVLNRYRVTAM